MTEMVIFDFSGTLSLKAALYASTENLRTALERSGLKALGIDDIEMFWSIVNATWDKGSTSSIGYKGVIQNQLTQSLAVKDSIALEKIYTCVSNFVDNYFSSSVIDPLWKDVICSLLGKPETVILVATDNYSEATNHIIAQMKLLGFNSLAISTSSQGTVEPSKILIANLADLGTHKSTAAFWHITRQAFNQISRVILVDDFGYNEQSNDSYANQQSIEERLQRTYNSLSFNVCSVVKIFPFFINEGRSGRLADIESTLDQYRVLIGEAKAFIDEQ